MLESTLEQDLSKSIAELTKHTPQLKEGLLISATYDGELRVVVLKFYDPNGNRFWLWYDNSGHKPYCFTKLSVEELSQVKKREDIIGIEEVEKQDLLKDEKIRVRKIVAKDPLAIGGSQTSVRDMIMAWEADIKYYENYVYDKDLKMGTYYSISNSEISPIEKEVPASVAKSLNNILSKNSPEFVEHIKAWAELLGQPLVDFKRIAIDIEVDSEENRLPDPEKADRQLLAVSFLNDAERIVYLLRRNAKESPAEIDGGKFEVELFDDEVKMIRQVFRKILQYPFLITFNGDDFDLKYLRHRAQKLGIRDNENPIQMQRQEASLKHGVHLDLYRTFNNKSIQVYAYGNKYSERTLNGVAEGVLGKSKMEFEGSINDLPLKQLADYCLNDSQLTYELTSNNDSALMKLLLVLARVAKMPINDLSRLGVSNWIRSMLFSEHRKIGALIPRSDELLEKGGASSEAIIKGKKYKGGLVIEPKPGVHFNIAVLDFASLVYDEAIFVRKRQTGQMYRTKIGDFAEQRLEGGEGLAASKIGPTWDVLSFDYEKQQASWKTVTAVIRHPNQADVLEVVTESGRRVTITKGHSVISLDSEGKKKTVRGSELKVGDYLVVLSSFRAKQHDASLDLLPYFRQLRDYDITRGGKGHGSTVILTATRSHRKSVVQRFLPMTSDLLWGLGYWMAEGWLGGDKYGEALVVEAASSEIEFARSKFNTAGFKTWMSKSKTNGCSNLGIGSRYDGSDRVLSATIFARLVKTWFGSRARDKRIPNWILQLPLDMRRAFIDGYYKGDGYNSSRYGQFSKNGKYKVGSYSQLLINDLMSLGLMSGFHCFSKDLNDVESFLTWSNDGAETYRQTKRPPPELLVRSEHVQSFARTPYYASHRQRPVRYQRVNKTSVEAFQSSFCEFYNGNCHFEKVTQIIAVDNKLPVYDISVRGSESFFNGDGILVSNSLYPSLIKVFNLSYDTVNCPHPECRTNLVPGLTHWVCTRRKGITSLVIGSLRDLRVSHYKPLGRDKGLSANEHELYNIVSQGLKVFLNACFTGDTIVVTPGGLRNIKDLKVGESVININPDTLQIETDQIVQTQQFLYDGELYHFRNNRCVDLMVTPNHRLVTIDRGRGKGAIFRTAEEVYKTTNIAIPRTREAISREGPERISLLDSAKKVGASAHLYPGDKRLMNWFRTLPVPLQEKIRANGKVDKNTNKLDPSLKSRYILPAPLLDEADIDSVEAAGGFVLLGEAGFNKIPVRYESEKFASLCGWFVSEGYPYYTAPKSYANGAPGGRSLGITLSQAFGRGNPRGTGHRHEIRELLSDLGLRYSTDSGDNIYLKTVSSVLHQWFIDNCYQFEIHDAEHKKIPSFVFESQENMRAFLESVYKGDGSARQTCYSTRSLKLAEDLVVLLTFLGAKSKIKWDNGMYRLTFTFRSSKLTFWGTENRKNIRKVPYSGPVYCVTTGKNQTVFAGRDGKFVPVGQSYGVFGFETFALYCLPVAEATAALGRHAITKTIEKCKELGIDVVYSDSVTAERCITLQDPNGFIKILPVEEFFEQFGEPTIRSDEKQQVHPLGWNALSMHPSTGVVSFKAIKAVIRHRTNKKVYRVFEKWGCTRVTEDHSLVTLDNGSFTLSRPMELVGKHLLRADHIPPVRSVLAVDVYEVMKPISYTVSYKRRIKIMSARTDGEWVWFGWTNRKNPIKVRRYILAGTPEFKALVEILGAYVAEGSSSTPDTTRSKLGASLACADVAWLSELREDYTRLFLGAKANIIPSNLGQRHLSYRGPSGEQVEVEYEDRTHRLQMMNEVSAVFFRAFCGQKNYDKEIPSFIYHAPDEYKRIFLDNMVRGDGSRVFGRAYSDEYRKKNFRYETKSTKLASGLAVLLAQLGVKYSLRYRNSKQTYSFHSSTEYSSRTSKPVVQEEDYDGYVYDLSVEDNHTFVDSCGNIVLKNTDSLFLQNPSTEQIDSVIHSAEHDLGVELELDKRYRYVAFSARKKNYFGLLADGTPDIKGLSGKKSMTPEFLKKTFYEVLKILGDVRSPDDFERARNNIKELLTRTMSSLKRKEIPVSELAFNVMIGKPSGRFSKTTPQHVKAAKLLEEKGRQIKAGDIISFVKTKTPPYVKPADLARPDEIDADKYLEFAQSMFDQVLDALGFSFDEIMGSTTLDLFWS